MTAQQVQELPYIVLALLAATVLSFALTPVAISLARRSGAIDLPDAGRRVHRLAIPRGGGLAVAISFIVIGTAAVWLNGTSGPVGVGRIGAPELITLLGGCGLAAVLGLIDDRWQIRARWQLLAQLLLAAIVIVGGAPRAYVAGVPVDGIRIGFVANPFNFLGDGVSSDVLPFAEPVAIALTAIWIVGMINSLNFIDGLDGLSTGIALIASVTLGLLSISQGQPLVGLLCFVLAGALAGFLPWNFHPATVFTGTTGVVAVGYVLAVLSILGTAKVAVALLVLGVPIIDTFWIIIRRVSNRQSPFTPDRGHFHHRLLDLGLTHRSAVLVIYGICIALAFLSLVLPGASQIYAFMGIVVGGGLVLYLLTRHGPGALDASSYPDDEAARAEDAATQDTDGRLTARPAAEAPAEERRRGGTRPVR